MFFLISLFSVFSLKSKPIVDIIMNSPDHDTLEAAVIALNLLMIFPVQGSLLYSPTDAAFKALPAGTIEALLADHKCISLCPIPGTLNIQASSL